MSNIIDTFPENVYKKELKDLIDSIWLQTNNSKPS
jgi:hypothetical protein